MVATVTQLHSPAQEIERLQSLFAKQKAAFRHTPMPTAKARIEQLNKLKAAVIRHQDSIASAVNEDFSCRAKDETLIAEIMITVQSLNYMIKNVRKWMRPSRRHVSALFAHLTKWFTNHSALSALWCLGITQSNWPSYRSPPRLPRATEP